MKDYLKLYRKYEKKGTLVKMRINLRWRNEKDENEVRRILKILFFIFLLSSTKLDSIIFAFFLHVNSGLMDVKFSPIRGKMGKNIFGVQSVYLSIDICYKGNLDF